MERFTRDLKERSYRQRVETDRKSGLQSGVSGPPSFFVNGERFEEPWDDGVLMSALLEKAGSR
jgi:protein-disulfide isomerase